VIKTQTVETVPAAAGQTPGALAVSGPTAYVAFSGAGGPGVWVLVKGAKSAAPVITLPQPADSLTATPAAVYALLTGGSFGVVDVASSTFKAATITAQAPVDTASPDEYVGGAVPTPTAGSSTFGPNATVAIDPASPQQVLVGDPTNSRILRLAASDTGSITLTNQYVYGHPVSRAGLFAIAAYGTQLDVYLWNGSTLLAFTVAEPAA
jgi:hypothetical protein